MISPTDAVHIDAEARGVGPCSPRLGAKLSLSDATPVLVCSAMPLALIWQQVVPSMVPSYATKPGPILHDTHH